MKPKYAKMPPPPKTEEERLLLSSLELEAEVAFLWENENGVFSRKIVY